MRKYDNYIDSNIEWLGDIPSHWTLTKNKRVLNLLTDFTANGSFGDLAKNVQYLDSGYARLVRLTDLRLNLNNSGLYVSKYSYEYLKKSSLKGGELVVANVGANVGTVCIVPETDEIKTLGPNMFLVGYKNILNKKYIFYLLCSDFLQYEFKVVATTTAQPKLNKDQFRSLNITIPPLIEQQAIANYLDAKTQAIDKKVSLLEQKIETYKQLKRTLINQTITKGLRSLSEVEMKDSGISWIGQIPQHWEVKRLKELGNIETSSINKKIEEDEDLVKLVNYTDVYSNLKREIWNNDDYMIVSANKLQISSKKLKQGDVLFTPSSETINDIGVSAVVMENLHNTLYSYHLLRLRFRKVVDLHFKKYLFSNDYVQYYFSKSATGTTRKILGLNTFNNLEVLLPPKSEQEEIAKYLDHKTATIDAIVSNIGKQIDTLKQLRKTLINDVVTGKIKVCDD